MNQLFINIPDVNILLSLLNKICQFNSTHFILDKISFKTAKYNKYLDEFCKELLPYYYKSKQFYITRKITYTNFLTIIRQLCNINNIDFTSSIVYDKSNYNIIYYIIKNN